MTKVMPGHYTAQIDDPFVVFLIGMRINKWLAFSRWIPTARAMVPMLRTPFQHPEKGFLGGQVFFYWRGIALVQYWRSFEDLETFARNRQEPHLAAWHARDADLHQRHPAAPRLAPVRRQQRLVPIHRADGHHHRPARHRQRHVHHAVPTREVLLPV